MCWGEGISRQSCLVVTETGCSLYLQEAQLMGEQIHTQLPKPMLAMKAMLPMWTWSYSRSVTRLSVARLQNRIWARHSSQATWVYVPTENVEEPIKALNFEPSRIKRKILLVSSSLCPERQEDCWLKLLIDQILRGRYTALRIFLKRQEYLVVISCCGLGGRDGLGRL